MSTPKKVQKADIVQAALEILKTEPIDSLTARRLAEVLNCSVQPIFYNFATMDELKTRALDTIHQIYLDYMEQGSHDSRPYKGMGLAYIRFARDYPSYFKLLFMNKTDLTPETFIDNDDLQNHILEHGMKFSGLGRNEMKPFHLKVWIFTHGLASLVATDTVQISDAEVDTLLETTVHEILVGHKTIVKMSSPPRA